MCINVPHGGVLDGLDCRVSSQLGHVAPHYEYHCLFMVHGCIPGQLKSVGSFESCLKSCQVGRVHCSNNVPLVI